MNLTTLARVQRGESFSWALAARPEPAGDPLPGDLATAVARSALKPMGLSTEIPAASVAEALSATGVWTADLGDGVAGWLFSLTAAQMAGLAVGRYALDVRVTRAGGVVLISEAAAIQLVESVTGP